MKFLLALLALAVTAMAAERKPPVGVPADAKHFNGKWYRVYLEKVPWNRAKEKCKELGGQLVTIPDAATWKFVKSLCGQSSIWLGANDEKTEGAWVWPDGTQMSFSAWFQAQPDNARGVEHFLSTYKGQWNDAPKNGEFVPNQFVVGYVCEWSR